MLRSGLCACWAVAILAGCSPVPNYVQDVRVKPVEVAARVQCEIKRASLLYSTKRLNLDDYSAGFTLALKVETDTGPDASADWVIPYHLTDTFTGGLKAGLKDYVLRDGSINYSVRIDKLRNFKCPAYIEAAYLNDPHAAEVTYGSFGIADWFGKMASTLTPENFADPGKMDYTVKFGVTGNATASPGFRIVNLTSAVNLAAKRIDTHTLTLAFTRNALPPPPAEPLEVCITNLPDSKPCKPDIKTLAPPRVPRPGGVDPRTQQQLDQQLEMLRLRDILRQ
jgi:hypothetical protein